MMVKWKVTDGWDEENNWPREGRTVLIYKGGDRRDPSNNHPITYLPTITKMVTLAIHKRMRKWLFGSVEESILECEQRGVRSSKGMQGGCAREYRLQLDEEERKEGNHRTLLRLPESL